jgi:3-hydroxyacyl-CoA dehydrogenase
MSEGQPQASKDIQQTICELYGEIERRMIVATNKEIQNVAIVGTGVIGASWAAYYLSRGFNVVATDPAANAEANLRKYVDEAWKTLSKNDMFTGASRDRLTFAPSMAQALAKAHFVQENAPERPDFKARLFAEMDDATPLDSILASSSSSITMDVIQSACKRPERCVIGHPFNPPQVIPLVEVVGGAKTSPQTIEKAMAFYSSIGKKPIRLFKALPGHVANRLQAALYKEVLYLIQQGVLSVADADAAVCYGPGPRWGVMGPKTRPTHSQQPVPAMSTPTSPRMCSLRRRHSEPTRVSMSKFTYRSPRDRFELCSSREAQTNPNGSLNEESD